MYCLTGLLSTNAVSLSVEFIPTLVQHYAHWKTFKIERQKNITYRQKLLGIAIYCSLRHLHFAYYLSGMMGSNLLCRTLCHWLWRKCFNSRSDFPRISWPWYRTCPSPKYAWFPWSICNGCGMPAVNAYPSGHLVPSPFLGLVSVPIVETRFFELAMYLLDFSPWIPLSTFSILLYHRMPSAFFLQISR